MDKSSTYAIDTSIEIYDVCYIFILISYCNYKGIEIPINNDNNNL